MPVQTDMSRHQSPGGAAVSIPAAPWQARGEHDRRVQFLSRVGLFQGVSPELLAQVAAALRPAAVDAGAVVCREGDPGDQLFIIEAGTLAVLAELGDQPRPLARLGPGEFFGEMALLGQGRRTATVRAETAAQLWSLAYPDLQALLAHEPALDSVLRRAARLREIETDRAAFEVEHRNLAALAAGQQQIRIGRGPDNDLVFNSRLVSRHHAVVEWSGQAYRLRDLGSSNGTYVNGRQVRTVDLADGDEIWLGDQRFVFDRREIQRVVEPRGIRIDVANLTKEVKGGKRLLNDVTLSVLPGEFVAIVGGSGAGKTTLMDAMSGVRPASGGSVRYNGRDYYRNIELYRNVLGYVPQDDIIHTELPVRATLRHAAKLRLPADSTRADIDAAVDQAIEVLGLTNQAGVRVGALSGGQRKRSSIGVELLTRPRAFFLDEPTSGLDPATDAQMMRLMRRLADDGSTVLLTTHATKNVMLCDKVIFLARGGQLAFIGPPQRALAYFGAEAFDQIYERLADEATPEEWAQRFRDSADYRQVVADQPRAEGGEVAAADRQALGDPGRGGLGRQFRQFGVLTRRSFDLYAQNPANFMPLLMQPVVFALALLALFHSGSFSLSSANPNSAVQINFILAFNAFLFGLLYGIQQIVREFPIFRRERMVSLGIVPYVLSKMAVLVPILVIAEILMVAILRIFGRLPSSGFGVYGQILLTLWLTAFAALALSLLMSAAVSTVAQSSEILPLPIMPQVYFSGAILAIPSMGVVGRLLSNLMISRWSFEALGRVTDLNNLFANDTNPDGGPIGQALKLQYQDSFSRNPVQNWLILLAFIAVPLLLTCLVLKRKTAVK